MRAGIATDHGGFGLKDDLVTRLRASGHEVVDWEQAPSVPGAAYRTEPRSVVVLFAGLDPES